MQDFVALFVAYLKDSFIKVCRAVVVAQLSKTEEVIGEARYDVSGTRSD
jgi:hypothetical protein